MKKVSILAALLTLICAQAFAKSPSESIKLECEVPKAKVGYTISMKTMTEDESEADASDDEDRDDQATLIEQHSDEGSFVIGKGKAISTTGSLSSLDLEIRTVAHLKKIDKAGCYARGTEYVFKLTSGIGGKGHGAVFLGEVVDRPVVRALKSKKEMMKCPIGPGGTMPKPGKAHKMSCKVINP